MKILLDTHCWLWMQVSPSKLSNSARLLIQDPENRLYLSAVSSWEMAIKWGLGKLPLPEPPADYVPRCMERQGVLGLAVQHRHALHMASLPPLHQDPFDRLLIAQAQVEGLALMTADEKIALYPDVELFPA